MNCKLALARITIVKVEDSQSQNKSLSGRHTYFSYTLLWQGKGSALWTVEQRWNSSQKCQGWERSAFEQGSEKQHQCQRVFRRCLLAALRWQKLHCYSSSSRTSKETPVSGLTLRRSSGTSESCHGYLPGGGLLHNKLLRTLTSFQRSSAMKKRKVSTIASLGSKHILPSEIFSKLYDHLLKLANFGIDFMDVKSLVIKLSRVAGNNSFVAGEVGWMVSKCAFQTCIVCGQQHWKEHTDALNPELCGSLSKLLKNAINHVKELSRGTKLTPDEILNVDRIGFTMDLTAGYDPKKFIACTCIC